MIETPDTAIADNAQLDQSLSLLKSSLKNSYSNITNSAQNSDYNPARFFLASSQDVKGDSGTVDYSTPAFVQSFSDTKDQDNMIGIIDGESDIKPKLSIAELSSFVEYRDINNTYKHTFVDMKNVELVSTVDRTEAKQLYIKYPSLRELISRAPKDCLFLIRIGCEFNIPVNLSATEGYFAYTIKYTSNKCSAIRVTSKLYNCGNAAVETILSDYGHTDSSGITNFNFNRIQLCDHMATLLRNIQIDFLNNSDRLQATLENTGIMQVIQDRESQEILLVLLLEFEINHIYGHYRVYKIV